MTNRCAYCGVRIKGDHIYCSPSCRKASLNEKLSKIVASNSTAHKKISKPKVKQYKCRICGGLTTQPYKQWDTAGSSTFFCTDYCWGVYKSQISMASSEHRLQRRRMTRVPMPLEEDIAWEDIRSEDS